MRTTYFAPFVVGTAALAEGLGVGLALGATPLDCAGLGLGAGRGLTASISVVFLCIKTPF